MLEAILWPNYAKSLNEFLSHREASRNSSSAVSVSDLELHRRLLRGLNKDCAEMCEIFGAPVGERMAVIAADAEAKRLREGAEDEKRAKERRVSAATKAKIEQRLRGDGDKESRNRGKENKESPRRSKSAGRANRGM